MAESTISTAGTSRRAKRAARACNHCRWKRLKCSDQSQNESCMNCIIYGTKCEYTTGWSSQGGSGKRKSDAAEGGGGRASKTRKKQKASDGGRSADGDDLTPGRNSHTADDSSRASRSPPVDSLERAFDPMEGAEGGVDSADAVHIVGEDEHAGERGTDTVLVHDQLGKKLVHYLTPMMTGVDNDEDIALSAEDAGLPPEPIAVALVNAFFDNIQPLYPIIDEIPFRQQLQDYYRTVRHVDRLWLMLVKLVMCTGACAVHDSVSLGYDMRALREALFMQVLSSAYLVYTQVKLRTSQILLLIALYCTQIKRPNSAWLWCRWAIRMTCGSRTPPEQSIPMNARSEGHKIRDIVQWSLFTLESQLALSQFRDDPRFAESTLKQPGEDIKKLYPAFCHRLALARVTHKFCKMGLEGGPNATRFANLVENLHASVRAWKEGLPAAYQPENQKFTESPDFQCFLLMHVEYYGLLLAMFTALGAAARLLPNDNSYVQHPSARVRNQIAVRINNSRNLLRTIEMISETANYKPNVTCWITPVQILGPFSFLYSHIMRRPALPTANSDLELLYSASQHFRHYMADSPRNKNISSLIAAMYNAASNFVNQARINAEAINNIESSNAASVSVPNYSELRRPRSNDSPNHADPNTNNDTPLSNSHEFDYSPTIVAPPADQLGSGQDPASRPPIHHFHYNGQNLGHHFFDESRLMQPPNIMSEADVARMLAEQSHPQSGHLIPAPSPYPEVMGLAMATGWDDWLWHNDLRQQPR